MDDHENERKRSRTHTIIALCHETRWVNLPGF